MFDEFRVRSLYIIDLVFAVAVGLLYLVFQIGLFEAGVHVRELFTGTLTLLGIGTALFYLTNSMNLKFAFALHLSFFPLSGTLYLFTKWAPKTASSYTGNAGPIYMGALAYMALLITYCCSHFLFLYLSSFHFDHSPARMGGGTGFPHLTSIGFLREIPGVGEISFSP
ncbi:hypothetical protein AKJ57_03095 [candidate division MSBL1 archaeon SCGC-AAA259A05]|uniref:Uncharacterized protein n=1 Tax=candidate division MSBL1 archaeon SCGC-AAA259A05 TaxID=1698259 RepID=A0A133U9S7_9EURY|nr:hypothetical protein AKJ57_03095 [candidate division MSBL1 archaeon SCGC-AAA259A05]